MPSMSRQHPILALLACTGLLLAMAAPVAGHAELVEAMPADGAQLDATPAEVILTFSAELDPDGSRFTVTGPGGSTVGAGAVDLQVADRNVLRGPIAGAGRGAYAVAWSAVAADGHQETGTLHFNVGRTGLADTALPTGSTPALLVGWLLVGAAVVLLTRQALGR